MGKTKTKTSTHLYVSISVWRNTKNMWRLVRTNEKNSARKDLSLLNYGYLCAHAEETARSVTLESTTSPKNTSSGNLFHTTMSTDNFDTKGCCNVENLQLNIKTQKDSRHLQRACANIWHFSTDDFEGTWYRFIKLLTMLIVSILILCLFVWVFVVVVNQIQRKLEIPKWIFSSLIVTLAKQKMRSVTDLHKTDIQTKLQA